jgi:hypothetical protein
MSWGSSGRKFKSCRTDHKNSHLGDFLGGCFLVRTHKDSHFILNQLYSRCEIHIELLPRGEFAIQVWILDGYP